VTSQSQIHTDDIIESVVASAYSSYDPIYQIDE